MLPEVSKPRDLPGLTTSLQTALGLVVRTRRLRLGISQEQLAERSDLHRTYVTDVERGARNISLRSIANLAAALEISLGDLFKSASGGLGLISPGDTSRKLGEVLLVEDNASDAELAARALRRAAFTNPVRTLDSGEAALEFLLGSGGGKRPVRTALPLLVLLDLGLPGLPGTEVLRRLKADEKTKAIPVVVLTASHADRTIIECARLGASHYIIKPVGFDSLKRISAKLNLRWMLRPPRAASPPSTSL
ncbi:MAG: response regulator [Opitutaceae bacterium]